MSVKVEENAGQMSEQMERRKLETRERRLKELQKAKDEISEEVNEILEQIRKDKAEKEACRIDQYIKTPWYKGRIEVGCWREMRQYKNEPVYIRILSEDQTQGKGRAKCLMIRPDGIEVRILPLFCPRQMRRLMTEEMMERWVIEDFKSISEEEFREKFEERVSSLKEMLSAKVDRT